MSFEIICFDCDSTLSRIEGIDELARDCGMFAQVAALTDAAMNGEIALEEVYAKRLSLIKPDQSAIDRLAALYISEMVEGVEETFAHLQAEHKQIHIISGGLRQAILPLAAKLSVPEHHVHAVDVFFNRQGHYQGFDVQSPLARNGGKAIVCQQIYKPNVPMAMVGDGKTDLEARQAGACVIGFGGVVRRELVEMHADYYVAEASLTAVLPKLLCSA
ncbi:MAG: HAD-IB family phosphatase [Methylomonas sp.]